MVSLGVLLPRSWWSVSVISMNATAGNVHRASIVGVDPAKSEFQLAMADTRLQAIPLLPDRLFSLLACWPSPDRKR